MVENITKNKFSVMVRYCTIIQEICDNKSEDCSGCKIASIEMERLNYIKDEQHSV